MQRWGNRKKSSVAGGWLMRGGIVGEISSCKSWERIGFELRRDEDAIGRVEGEACHDVIFTRAIRLCVL